MVAKQFKRYEGPDTEWSDPGSTFGIPDRWTMRQSYPRRHHPRIGEFMITAKQGA